MELHADDGAAGGPGGLDAVSGSEPSNRQRPNVSGDLPTVLQVGPMFRRAVAGYDRFQVDTYVRWAEDELAAADRERERLMARYLGTQAALGEARELLSHSSGGGRFLEVSRRIGSMLAAATDEAESIRAEAENHRCVARAQAEVVIADAHRTLAEAAAEAASRMAEAATEVTTMRADAARIIAEAEQTRSDAGAEAASLLAEARRTEQRAVEQAERIRQQAVEEAQSARLRVRDEVVRMLGTGREERRRADAEAAAVRDRMERDVLARRWALMAEVDELERRHADLRAKVHGAPEHKVPRSRALHLHARAYLERIQGRIGWHPATGPAGPGPAGPGPAGPLATRDGERSAA